MNLPQYAAATKITPAAFREKLEVEHGVIVTHEAVRLWFLGERQPGHKKMDAIEKATGGKVSRHDQRPDVFGPRTPKRQRRAA